MQHDRVLARDLHFDGGFRGDRAAARLSMSPCSSAVASACSLPIVTVTFSPVSAHPQTRTGFSLCNTMWSPKMCGSRTSARLEPDQAGQSVRQLRATIRAIRCGRGMWCPQRWEGGRASKLSQICRFLSEREMHAAPRSDKRPNFFWRSRAGRVFTREFARALLLQHAAGRDRPDGFRADCRGRHKTRRAGRS